jgi:hypothetical protein
MVGFGVAVDVDVHLGESSEPPVAQLPGFGNAADTGLQHALAVGGVSEIRRRQNQPSERRCETRLRDGLPPL